MILRMFNQMNKLKISKPNLLALAVMAALLLGAFFGSKILFADHTWSLSIEDPRSNEVYYQLQVKPEEVLTLSCRNSVSKSLVTGTFIITGKKQIKPLTTAFTAYGPGLPMDFVEEYVIADGVITVFHNEEPRDSIRIWVNRQTEETIYLKGQTYPLWTLSDNPLLLNIYIE
jgi:hypothetical protein